MQQPVQEAPRQAYEPPRLEKREELVLVTAGTAVSVGGTQPMW